LALNGIPVFTAYTIANEGDDSEEILMNVLMRMIGGMESMDAYNESIKK
jgi:hypothetical protein